MPLRLPHTWQEMKTLSLRSEDKAEVAPDELGLSPSLLSLFGGTSAHFSFLMQIGGGTDHHWPGQQRVGEDGEDGEIIIQLLGLSLTTQAPSASAGARPNGEGGGGLLSQCCLRTARGLSLGFLPEGALKDP